MRKSNLKLTLLLLITVLIGALAFTSCDVIMGNIPNTEAPDTAEKPDGNPSEEPTEKPAEIPDETPDVEEPGEEEKPECSHLWVNYVHVKKPTCGTDETGLTTSTCFNCGEVREEVTTAIYSKHYINIKVTAAECGVDGLSVDFCINCDYRVETVLPALEHEYKLMKLSNDGTFGFACKHCRLLDKYVSYVTYEDFGAVGDGVTDDSDAIRAAHEAANECGLKVIGRSDATYYIGPIAKTIKIQTDTDWNGATFIFDDHQIPWDNSTLRGVHVFTIAAETGSKKITVPPAYSLSKGQTNVGLTFDSPCMLKIVNANEKIYIRYGVNANDGANKYELILVDENGNVDPSTPIQYDYTAITELTAYSVEDKPIFVGNGKIITVAPNPKEYDPDYENNYCYYKRGIVVNRSNTTLYSIEHVIVGEDMTVEKDRNGDGIIDKWGTDKSYGVPYSGFFTFSGCNNATLTDTIVQGHQAYSFYLGV